MSLQTFLHQSWIWKMKTISKKLSECSARMMKVWKLNNYRFQNKSSPVLIGCIPAEEMKFVLSTICSEKVEIK